MINKRNANANISIVIPTRDRPDDLHDLLLTILNQEVLPAEVVVVDDGSLPSSLSKYNIYIDSFLQKFSSAGSIIIYIKGSGEGLPSARNLGVKNSNGEVIFFLDDDTLLDKNVLSVIDNFFKNHSKALGIQVNIKNYDNNNRNSLVMKSWNILNRIFMLTSYSPNKLLVRRSGFTTFPYPLTKVITAQRLSGCSCYRRIVFNDLEFDEKMKRWANLEDTDFSYRLYKKHQDTLFAIPYAKVIHKGSTQSRLPMKTKIYMSTVYWFYVFFKDIYDNSILNLFALLWTMVGNLLTTINSAIIKRNANNELLFLVYLLKSYIMVFKNLKCILTFNLDFFNEKLGVKYDLHLKV